MRVRVCGCVGMHVSEGWVGCAGCECGVCGDASEGMWVCGDARE